MEKNRKISMAVIRRLPKYYRHLDELLSDGIFRISSNELSRKMNITASQIRQDLNNFGGFGQQGYGYNVEYLYDEIKKILGINHNYNLIIIGAGNLGQALANYANFEKRGFTIKALFDINPKLINLSLRGVEILDFDTIEDYATNHLIDIAVLTLPNNAAAKAAQRLHAVGIEAFWNFSAADLFLPEQVLVENVYLTDSLITLTYRLNENNGVGK